MNFWLISLSHFSLILKILGYKCWGSDKAWKCQSRLSCFTCRACAPGRVVGPISTILITVFMLMTPKYNRCIKQPLNDLDKSVSSLGRYLRDAKCGVSANVWCLNQNWFYLARCLLNSSTSFTVPLGENRKLPPRWIILVLYLTLKSVLRPHC